MDKLYKKLNKGVIQCLACSHKCTIKESYTGICGVRMNRGDKIELLVYGKPCAVWVDPIEKKPLFHFLPGTLSYSIGTFGCNFKCEFCQNWEISQMPGDDKYWLDKLEQCPELNPEDAVKEAERAKCKSISYTYTEPTIFSEYAKDIGILAKEKGIANVYVTNGYESKECWNYCKGFLDAVNIDLKGSDEFYKRYCGARLDPVKESVEYAKKLGIWVEVTTLIIPNENDDEEFLKETAEFLAGIDPGIPWHITAFHPEYRFQNRSPATIKELIKAREIGKEAGLKYVYCGNLKSEFENTVCNKCEKIIVERIGFEVIRNEIIDGKCRFCKNKIEGIYEH